MKKIQLKKVVEDLTFNGRCWPIKCLEGKWLTDEEPQEPQEPFIASSVDVYISSHFYVNNNRYEFMADRFSLENNDQFPFPVCNIYCNTSEIVKNEGYGSQAIFSWDDRVITITVDGIVYNLVNTGSSPLVTIKEDSKTKLSYHAKQADGDNYIYVFLFI